MTSAQDPQGPQNTWQQPGPPPDLKRTVVVNIDQYLRDGTSVFDASGERVRTVKLFSTAAGYLLVGQGPPHAPGPLHPLPAHPQYRPAGDRALRAQGRVGRPIRGAARHAHGGRAALCPRAGATRTSRDRDTMPQAYEVREVQSGYNSALTAVDRVEPASIAERLSVVPAVSDADGVRMGDISQYDTARGLLTEEMGLFTPTVLLVPFSAIRSVDRDELSVSLTPPRATLVQDQATLRSNS